MMFKLFNNKKNKQSLIILLFKPNNLNQENNLDKKEKEVNRLTNQKKKLKLQRQDLKKFMQKSMLKNNHNKLKVKNNHLSKMKNLQKYNRVQYLFFLITQYVEKKANSRKTSE